VAVAERGARNVYGIDVRPRVLQAAADLAAARGVAKKCNFLNVESDAARLQELRGTVDVIYSLDCFEHYPSPDAVLNLAYDLLAPGGRFVISFGPPWYHPYGAHMTFFCRVPWVHLLFTERTILAVRGLYRNDGASRFEEVDGGLNRMSIKRFERLIRDGSFSIERLSPVPIRHTGSMGKAPGLREFFTSVVQCSLIKPVS